MKTLFKMMNIFLLCFITISGSWIAMAGDFGQKVPRQFVYASSNSVSGNAVVGYKIASGGDLKPLPGSPFATAGLGQGNTLLVSSDSGIAVSADNRFLFVPNRGSNDISVFRIRADGTLASVPGSPFPTGGVTPTSLTVSENTLFVAHTGLGLFGACTDCDYRGFHVSGSGQLTPIQGAFIKLSETPPSGPLALRFSPDGRLLIGTELIGNKINVYKVDRDYEAGQVVMTPAPGSPFSGNGKLPLGFNFNPSNPTQLFISNAGQGSGTGSVSPFLLAKSGQISAIEEPRDSGQSATCWINLTADGKWLFASNTNSDSVSTFQVTADGRLALSKTTPMPRNGIAPEVAISPVDMAMTSGDEYLYVLSRTVPAVTGFKIGAGGELTPVANAKIGIADAVPFGLVAVDLNKPRAGKSFESDD